MPIRQIYRATCDRCHEDIDTGNEYIDAMVYGAVFHPNCWQNLSAPELARLLGLDDIHYAVDDNRLRRVY